MSVVNQNQKVIAHPVKLRLDQLERQNLGILNILTGQTYRNDLLGYDDAEGVVAGQVAAVDPDSSDFVVCDMDYYQPLGIFGVSSYKEIVGRRFPDEVRVINLLSGGIHEINVYETYDHREHLVELEYQSGDLLYASPYGFLTKIQSTVGNGKAVGIVLRPHDGTRASMQIKLFDASGTGGKDHKAVTISSGSSEYINIDQNQVLSLNVGTTSDSVAVGDHTHEFNFNDVVGLTQHLQGISDTISLIQEDISTLSYNEDVINNLNSSVVSIIDNINNGYIANIVDTMNKLTPPPPPDLSSLVPVPDFNWVSARKIGSGELIQRVTLDRSPAFLINGVYTGNSGILSSSISRNNGLFSSTGTIDLSIGGTLSNGHLSSGDYVDYYDGQIGRSGFYYFRDCYINPTSSLVFYPNTLNKYNFKISHSLYSIGIDSQSFGDVHIDYKPGLIHFSSPETRIVSVNVDDLDSVRYVSGVPLLYSGAKIIFDALLKNSVSNFYFENPPLSVEGDYIVPIHLDPDILPVSYGQDILYENKYVSPILDIFTSDFNLTLIGSNAFSEISSYSISGTSPIHVDTRPYRENRVSSGVGLYPSIGNGPLDFGHLFDNDQSLLSNEELLDYGGIIMYPTQDFSGYIPVGPDFSVLIGFRWITLYFDDFSGSGVNLEFVNCGGSWTEKIPNDGMKIYVWVDGDVPSDFWINGHTPYIGSGILIDSSSGGLLMDSSTTSTTKAITFGEGGFKSGRLYVRIGLNEMCDQTFSNIVAFSRS